ncbi:MAG: FkbM family methyltransferase [Vicinamibacterales bacterium]
MTCQNPLTRATRLDAATLQSEVSAHLRNTQMSFLLRQGAYALCIPGHVPINWPTDSPRAGVKPAFYEETTTLVLNYLLERFRPSTFFDVGAAVGYFSRVAASNKHVTTRAHAFEMRPEQVSRLREILSNDVFRDKVSIHFEAVSDRDDPHALVWLARSLLFEQHPSPAAHREAWWRQLKFWWRQDRTRELSAATIPITSLDGFTARTGVLPDIVKIDVEGYEGRVLRGALETLASGRPFVLLELHQGKKLRFGFSRTEVANFLFELGYEALFFTDHQVKAQCEVLHVGPGNQLLGRRETDLLLFAHPDYCINRRSVF